uniref:Gypsy retrotransposon integrase-like protein 1 n=1 Tax=Cyprinus carpio TaxID=7962 RepID=A0A8C2EGQ3_CYPCA
MQWDIITEISAAQQGHPAPPECPGDCLFVPPELCDRVLRWVHCTPSAGHPGITATTQLVSNRFWWTSLRADVIKFVHQCSTCNMIKSSHLKPAGLLQPLPVPQRPWSHIAVNFVTDLPQSQGFTTILSVIDRFSKSCHFIPLSGLPTALQTAEALLNHVFRLFGLPEDIVTYRGPQFTSRVWRELCSKLNINVSLTSGYHPQASGQVERLNQDLTRFLRIYCHQNQQEWSRYLVWAEYAQNSLVKPATGLTPFQCVLGFQPPLFLWAGEPSDLPAVDSWLHRSEATWNAAHVHLQRAIHQYQHYAERRRCGGPRYRPGQWVWLSARDFHLKLPSKKLSPRFIGPFKILRQITPVSFRLALLITRSHLPFMCLFSDPQSPQGERRSKRGTRRCRILLLRLTARRPTGCERYWTPDVVAGLYSTSLTGRGMVLRNAPGSGLRTSWIPLYLPASIVTILTDLLPDSEEDPVDVLVLASGAARRGGAMSWDGLRRPPLAASDPSPLHIRTSFPSVPLCNHPRLTLPSYLDYH